MMRYLVLTAILVSGCQTPPIVDRKLNDVLVQNEDLRKRVMDLDDTVFDLVKRMEEAGLIKREVTK